MVFLKQLRRGLPLATGPLSLNQAPLHRTHQKCVIATSTKVDISGVKIPKYLPDAAEEAAHAQTPGGRALGQTREAAEQHQGEQRAVRSRTLRRVEVAPELQGSLHSVLALTSGLWPHALLLFEISYEEPNETTDLLKHIQPRLV